MAATFRESFDTTTVGTAPAGWATHAGGSTFVATTSGAQSAPNAFGPAVAANNNEVIKNGSAAVADGAVQLSSRVNRASSNYSIQTPLVRSDATSDIGYRVLFSPITGTFTFFSGELRQISGSFSSGLTFADGEVAVQKFETEGTTPGAPVILRYKIWKGGSAEPASWTAVHYDRGTFVTAAGTGYGAGPVAGLTGGGGAGGVIHFNVVGGVIMRGLVLNAGTTAYSSAPTIAITGGGGSGATATAVLDAYGYIVDVTITNGGTGYTNSPTAAVSAGVATMVLATNAAGGIAAAALVNTGSYSVRPTWTITGTGTSGGVDAALTSSSTPAPGPLGPRHAAGYRGSHLFWTGTVAAATFDDYFEGTIGTTFGGGLELQPTAANVTPSPYGWFSPDADTLVATAPGAYIDLKFTGPSLSMSFDQGSARTKVIASVNNGPRLGPYSLPAGPSILPLASGLGSGPHTARIWHFANGGPGAAATDRWGAGGGVPIDAFCVKGITLDTGAVLSAPTLKPKRVLIFGDSIGEGVAATPDTGLFNAVDIWPPAYATGLDAEYGQICHGGIGVRTPSIAQVPAADTSWSSYYFGHSRLVGGQLSPAPDYIFLEMGVNGSWTAADYTAWLVSLRAACPASTWIIACVPFGGQGRAAITTAVADYVAAHPTDRRTKMLDIGTQAGLTGSGPPSFVASDGLHPYTTFAPNLTSKLVAGTLAITAVTTGGGSGGSLTSF